MATQSQELRLTVIFPGADTSKPGRAVDMKGERLFALARDTRSNLQFLAMLMGGAAAEMTLHPEPGSKHARAAVKVIVPERYDPKTPYATL